MKGVTDLHDTGLTRSAYFNPHTREGCDAVQAAAPYNESDFNPHTREGCDITTNSPCSRLLNFNPHTREGCDFILDSTTGLQVISIHTPVKGVTIQDAV